MPHQFTSRFYTPWHPHFSLLTCILTVLIYDHRGIGNSSLSPAGNEEISIESLARDLLALLIHLNWKEVALCGYSMGGMFIIAGSVSIYAFTQ
jgi:pimeloyl-ACP methyl ester carboxylesterase